MTRVLLVRLNHPAPPAIAALLRIVVFQINPSRTMAPKRTSSASSTPKANTVAFPSSKASTVKGTSSAKKNVASSTKAATAPASPEDRFDPYDPAYSELFKESQQKMGTPVHGEGFTPVDVILKVFDTSDEWGPTSNLTRLERYERAERLGMELPPELGALLRACPASYALSSFQI